MPSVEPAPLHHLPGAHGPGHPSGRTRRSALAVLGLIVGLTALATGCSDRTDFADRTAVVVVGERTVRFTLDACGLDDPTLFVVGRTDDGEILQAVVELTDDGTTAERAGTGLTVDVGSVTYGAFGEIAWELRQGQGPVPGSVDRAALRGARIQVGGVAEPVDDDGRPAGRGATDEVAFSLDARCDERDTDRS